jgi:hypothetical protein
VPSWLRRDYAPDQAVADALRRGQADVSNEVQATTKVQRRLDRLAQSLALVLFKKRAGMTAEEFRVFDELLRDHGIDLVTHVGEPVDRSLEEDADILEWVDHEAGAPDGEHVVEAFEPEVRLDGRPLGRAKLCCMRAFEPPEEPDGLDAAGPAGTEGDDTDGAGGTASDAEAGDGASRTESGAEAGDGADQTASDAEGGEGAGGTHRLRRPGRWRRAWAALTGRDAPDTSGEDQGGLQ